MVLNKNWHQLNYKATPCWETVTWGFILVQGVHVPLMCGQEVASATALLWHRKIDYANSNILR